ncbi:MAG: PKD domain-containing protein [Acidobacteria bacterium]|nr:PKD domain-containing protein [Acidobacteriota bacterium]
MRQVRMGSIPLVVWALCSCLSLAQSSATIEAEGGPNKDRIKWLQPTVNGTTGLFTVYSGEGLRKGEFSFMSGMTNYDRSPGNLDISNMPVTFTLGLHDRLEWSIGFLPWRKVRAGAATQGYYNETPFLRVPRGGVEHEGMSDMFTSVKFNMMSETRNQPFGFAIRANVKIPTSAENTARRDDQLRKGLTTGNPDVGVEFLFSKSVGPATLVLNSGVQGVGESTGQRELQSEYRYGGGVALGRGPVQAIFEANGTAWFGDKGRNNPLTNPRAPIDLLWGLRLLPAKWLSVSAAYRFNARTWQNDIREPNRSGFLATVAVNRKINRPPTVECRADNTTVQQRGSVGLRATANDPDDSQLTINWRTTGGRLSGSGASVTFETGDLTATAPGRYTVTAEVSDGQDSATCSVDVSVEKLRIAPGVTCAPATRTIDMGGTAMIQASATDQNPGDVLRYAWQVDGQSVAESGSAFTFGTTGRNPGRHTVRVTVTDPDGMTASCESVVEVTAPPPPPQVNRPPTCDLSVSRNDLYAGSALRATARASDPDNDTLSYEWSLDGRTLSGRSGSDADIDTAGLAGGSHSVSARVTDSKGASVTCTASFTVRGKIVIELPALRIDNAAKARLDDVALQMQNDPRLYAVITGFDISRNARIAQRNGLRLAMLAKTYLVRQHKIEEQRIDTKSGGSGTPRRIEIEITSR